jgi:signal transduction histidine kinase
MPFDVANQQATVAQRRTVGALCAAVCVAAVVALPMASLKLPPLPHIAGIYGASAAMIDFATFWLLMSAHQPPRALRIVAAAYLFAGLMAVLHVLSFPGALMAEASVIGNGNSVSWLFLAWRVGFPVFILWAVWVQTRPQPGPSRVSPTVAAVAAVAVCLAAAQATKDFSAFTPGPQGPRFGAFDVVASYVGMAVAAVTLLLMLRHGLAWRRLYLWLMLVLVSETVGVWFSTHGGGRYTLAWYGARVEGLVASAIVLVLLATHFRELQSRLGTAVVTLSERTDALQAEIQHRERAERLLAQSQKLDAVGQLAAGLAHDINNFMQVVSMRAELIRRRTKADAALGTPIGSDVDVIQRNVRKAEHLTRQLLLFAGRRPLQPQAVRLQQLLSEFLEAFQPVLGKRAEVQLAIDADAWPAQADPTELEIALTNLLTNAADASEPGGVVALRVHNRADAQRVVIEVQDRGSGIPAPVLERVFEPFFTTKPAGKGTGLGLSQVYAFARGSGGDVQIDSQVGQGTTVRIELPRHIDGAATGTADAAPGAVPAGKVVLLVDDNADVLESTSSLLLQAGLAVRTASDAATALALLDGGLVPDVLLSDIVLGGTDGVTLAQRVRARLPAVRIVLATGYSAAAADARAQGFTVLQKPYDAARLLQAMGATASR